jgi:uncharacterized protein YndB with AHSA1/START domain
MSENLVARANITVDATTADVWDALVSPDAIKEYMFGTSVTSDFNTGSHITWQGEWQGRRYEDKGVILESVPEHVLQYSHFSPLGGLADIPENYHTVTIELSPSAEGTRVALSQDKNSTETEREHSQGNWQHVLEGLKRVVEGR